MLRNNYFTDDTALYIVCTYNIIIIQFVFAEHYFDVRTVFLIIRESIHASKCNLIYF